jgi:ubiquinone/menaquinone biosynthesis C-methylase UbiE
MSEAYNFEPYQLEILEDIKKRKVHNHPDYVERDIYKNVFDTAGLKPGDTVLDLGAGCINLNLDNSYTSELEHRGLIFVPVDDDISAVESWMLHPYHQRGKNETVVRPISADIRELPFADESIPFALSINVVNSPLENEKVFLQEMLTELYRVLRDGGQLLISSFGYYKMKNSEGTFFYNDGITEDHFVTIEDVKRAAERVGFGSFEDLPISEELLAKEFQSVQDSIKPEGSELFEIVHPFAVLIKKINK